LLKKLRRGTGAGTSTKRNPFSQRDEGSSASSGTDSVLSAEHATRPPDVEDAAKEGTEPPPSLQIKALRGSAWTIATFGSGQVLRLGSNLVLTRLLYPEAFGLMALVQIFLYGLHMLSDVGVATSVIQHRRGDESRFLNTAWTLQIIRGGALTLLAALIGQPAAWFYHEPSLGLLLPAVSLTAAISGLQSTAVLSLRRHMQLARISLLDLGVQVVGIVANIALAYELRSVWALVIGGVVAELVRTAVSHRLVPGYRNRFEWDPEAARAIYDFGKWILLSSACFFVAGQADRLYLGRLGGVQILGVFGVAALFTESLLTLVTNLTQGVLYPALSQVAREQPARVCEAYYRARRLLDLLALPLCGALCAAGSSLIHLLYDPRYHEAGWMLQLLAIRVAMGAISTPCETCLFAIGQTRYSFQRSLARALWVMGGIPFGWWLFGLRGLVTTSAFSELPVLLVLWPAFRRHGLLRPLREAQALLLFSSGFLVGTVLKTLPQWIHL
jgi:O-antigen/teichoic acid export membrane protein